MRLGEGGWRLGGSAVVSVSGIGFRQDRPKVALSALQGRVQSGDQASTNPELSVGQCTSIPLAWQWISEVAHLRGGPSRLGASRTKLQNAVGASVFPTKLHFPSASIQHPTHKPTPGICECLLFLPLRLHLLLRLFFMKLLMTHLNQI